MAGDALWPYVVLSMDFTGGNGVAGWGSDQRGNLFATQAGSPITSTSWAVSGSSSQYFNGSTRIISAVGIPALDFGTSDFEISLWVLQTSRSGSDPAALLNFNTDTPAKGWRLSIGMDGSLRFAGTNATPPAISTPAGAIPLNTSTHISVARISGTLYIRINGILQAAGTMSGLIAFGGQLQISGALGANWVYTGFMDRLEILKGVARHAVGSFTPETGPMFNYAGQISGVVRDNSGAPCGRTVRAYDRVSGALIASTTSDASTGAYGFNTQTLNEHNLVFLDDASGTLYNDIVARVIPA